MNGRAILFASLLSVFAITIERSPMLHAAEENAAEPGPSDQDAPKDFTATKSGLKYRVLRKSDGAKPTDKDSVKVNYKGWLDSGKQFDTSYGPENEPISFKLTKVIPGWTEGLQLVGTGGKIELEIPSKMGYGPRGFPPDIPPNATLHFIVELLDVIPPAKPGQVDKDAPEEFSTTKSGLKYRIRRKSDGKKLTADSVAVMQFKIWIKEGQFLLDTYDEGEAKEIPLKSLSIPGWIEGMQLIGKGGMIELDIPPDLAFGDKGNQQIPPKSRIHMLVEVFDVK